MLSDTQVPPLILVLDDVFGREVLGRRNDERENLCAHLLIRDVTGDSSARATTQTVSKPVARAVFCSAQRPRNARVGEIVENDTSAVIEMIGSRAGRDGKEPWALVLLDLCFYTGPVTADSDRRSPGMPEGRPGDDDPRNYFGVRLLEIIRSMDPDLPVVILSSKSEAEISKRYSDLGGLGFIARDDPNGPELLARAIQKHGLIEDSTCTLVGIARPLLLALRAARRAAPYRENVLIRGERGTGKELIAKYLHSFSGELQANPRMPYSTVNSAVLSSSLFASELFGIEPRTATGVAGKIGLIERAQGGDVFLDEIADMPLEAQAGLLRVLQERTVTRVGGFDERAVDIRFLSATNADFERADSGFRQDLLDRLRAGGTVHLPPLRDRLDDLPLLVERFVREAEARRAGVRRREVAPEAIECLASYDWPGNIRELRSVIFDAVVAHADVAHLVPGHLKIGAANRTAVDRESAQGSVPPEEPLSPPGELEDILLKMSATKFDVNRADAWSGKLEEVLISQARMNARLLLAAVEATKRRTPDRPGGIVQIHPAVKLLTGDPKLKPQKAGGIIKKILAPIAHDLEGDLKVAYDRALSVQPKNPKKNRARRSQSKDR